MHSNRLKPYTERVPEIPPEIQRERMTQSATAKEEEQNSAFGVPYHEESCQADQPMKRGRGRPRKKHHTT